MDLANRLDAASRSIAVWTLAIIGLIIAVSITILLLLARSHGQLLRSAEIAGDYHLASTVRAATIERHLRKAERQVKRRPDGTTLAGTDPRGAPVLSRIVYLLEHEMNALAESQRLYADPSFDAPLRRLYVQCDRLAHEVATHRATNDAEMIVARLDSIRLRLGQFRGLHWNAYLAHDSSAARAAGWRRFSLLSIIVAAAGLIPIVIATRQIIATMRERQVTDRRRRLLQAELDHRVKNNLAAVLSLSSQTVRTSSSLHEFDEAFTGRIVAMARTHEALARTTWSGIDLARAASLTLASHLDAVPPRITIEGASVSLPARAAMPMCLVLHELATNAVKHGAIAVPGGRVSVSWETHEGIVHLSWVEQGGPAVSEPRTFGLGTQLIEGFVRHELRGEVAIDYRPEGLVCRIALPLTTTAASVGGSDAATQTESTEPRPSALKADAFLEISEVAAGRPGRVA
ncbi:MAG: sensor histidine kinase [Phycisphaerales bacterium]|nr:sensor histidine kinase [Phycisphaerae bacterium]NNM25042.1 sensor histidine kinase [Phycisphaerales bacterium]